MVSRFFHSSSPSFPILISFSLFSTDKTLSTDAEVLLTTDTVCRRSRITQFCKGCEKWQKPYRIKRQDKGSGLITQTCYWQHCHGCVTLGMPNRNPMKDLYLTKIGVCTIFKDFIVFVTILLLFYALCFFFFFFYTMMHVGS